MTNELQQKFCRECYTTTSHKTILIKVPGKDKKYSKSICLRCLKVRKEQSKPEKIREKKLKVH